MMVANVGDILTTNRQAGEGQPNHLFPARMKAVCWALNPEDEDRYLGGELVTSPLSPTAEASRSKREGSRFESASGYCGRSSMAELLAVTQQVPVQLRAITPRARFLIVNERTQKLCPSDV